MPDEVDEFLACLTLPVEFVLQDVDAVLQPLRPTVGAAGAHLGALLAQAHPRQLEPFGGTGHDDPSSDVRFPGLGRGPSR